MISLQKLFDNKNIEYDRQLEQEYSSIYVERVAIELKKRKIRIGLISKKRLSYTKVNNVKKVLFE